MALDKTLELIKQATAFLQKEKNSPLHETPTSIIPSHSNTKQTHTFSGLNSSASSVEPQNTQKSRFSNKEARNFDPDTPKIDYHNVESKDKSFSSDGHSRANNISSERQAFDEHQAMNDTPRVAMSSRYFRNESRASENKSNMFLSDRNNKTEPLSDEKERDLGRERFKRRYSRNRFNDTFSVTPDLPANTMKKIEEATHLLRHGTTSSIPPSSLAEQANTTRKGKYFVSENLPQETTPSAMEPDMPPKGALLKHRGRGTRKGSQTPDFISNSPIASESPEHGVQVESSSLASSINGVSPTINEEPLKSTQASMYSTTRASHDAVAKSVPLWNPYARHVPRTGAEQLQQMQAPVVSPPNSRLLRIALLGLPNAGKSTLINALLEDRVCSVSNKPNSTRCLARAIYTTDDTQLVFLDTPGIVTPEQTIKHRLFGSVVQDAERSLAQADLLLLLHDCSSPFNRLGIHPRLLRVLALYPHIPAMLVMNKVDLVKPKQHLLKVTRRLTEGVVGGRPSHHDTIPSGPRDPFKDVTRDPDMLVKSFLDTLERKNNKVPEEEEEEEHRSAEDELDEPDALIPATQSTQQVTFDQLINGVNAVVLPNLDIASKFHVKTSVSDEDVLSGRVKLSEQQLAAFIEGRKGWPYFERVLLTSALKSDGVMALRQVLEDSAVPAPWQYPASMITDQDPYQMATLTVREKFMDKFKYQLPYNLRFEVDNWKIGDADSLIVRIRVICQEEGLIKLLVGASGCHVKTICQQAEQKLGQIFKADVRLQLIVSAEGKSHKVEDTQINKKAREQS